MAMLVTVKTYHCLGLFFENCIRVLDAYLQSL